MSDLDDLYREVLLVHSKHPEGKGDPTTLPYTHHELNPSCGDEITFGLQVEDGIITDVIWDGQGCSISMASASVLSGLLKGAPVEKAHALIEEFRHMLRAGTTKEEFEPSDDLEDAAAFQGVAKYVMRIKCAMLAWVCAEADLAQAEAA